MRLTRLIPAVFIAVLLGACGTAPMKTTGAEAPVMQSVAKATVPRQEGYLQLEVQNARYDAANPVLRAVADPYTSQEERLRRATKFPSQVEQGLADGSIKAASAHTYIVCLWGTDRSVPSSSVTGWRKNGTTLTSITVDDLSGRSNVCDSNQLGGKSLGAPDRIFRIRAEGSDARMVALQVPWVMLTAETAIMVCSAEKPTVYPGGDKGLWVSPTYLNRRMQGWEFARFAVVHER